MLFGKSKVIYDALKEMIESLPAGRKLPGIRELMQTYQVGRGLLERVLTELEHNDLIERVPCIGIFCKAASRERKRRITLITPNWPSEANFFLHSALQQAIEADGRFIYNHLNLGDQFFREMSDEMGDFLIVMPPSKQLSLNDLIYLKRLTVTVIFITWNRGDLDGHYVNTAPEYGGMLAAHHLISKGHRRLAVLVSEPHIAAVETRVSSFVQYARLQDAEVEVIDCNVHSYEKSAVKTYEYFRDWLAAKQPCFTGLFVISDSSALGALQALSGAGLRVPEDVSVIGYDGIPQGELFRPPLTSIFNDNNELAVRLVAAIGDCADGKNRVIRLYQKPRLLERSSVAEYLPQNHQTTRRSK